MSGLDLCYYNVSITEYPEPEEYLPYEEEEEPYYDELMEEEQPLQEPYYYPELAMDQPSR